MTTSATALRHRLIARARIRHLQVFVRIVELGTVKRAADAIGLTQPSVTHALADLELLLECKLFLRHARGMRVTQIGQALLPLARRILNAIDESAEQVIAMAGDASGVVRVAAITAAIAGLMVRAMPAFCQQHPEVLVRLEEADALQQADLVVRADVDFALCRAPSVTPDGWRFLPLMEDRFAVVAGPGHPLLRRSRVGMNQLREAVWLPTPSATAARDALDRLFEGEASPPRTCQLITRAPALLWAMLAREPLLAVVPWSFARQFIEAGQLFELSLDIDLPFHPIGILLPVASPGEAALKLIAFLQAFAASETAPAPQTKRRSATSATGSKRRGPR